MEKEYEKVEKNGKVAVLVSPGFGAGWWTWNKSELSPFEPKVVNMVLKGKRNEITDEWIKENLGVDIYMGGAEDLEVVWVDKGLKFSINEYDGSESLYIENELEFIA